MKKYQSDYKQAICLFLTLFLLFGVFAETGSAAPTQTIQSVRLSGVTLLQENQIDGITRPFLGQELDVGHITNLVNAITAAYRKEGFFLARAYLPEQEIQDGRIVISVLEGRVGKITVTGNTYYSIEFIQNHFVRADLLGSSRIGPIKRAVLILDDYPDLDAELLFKQGSSVGTTDMELQIKDSQPVHLTFDYNNFGSKLVSRDRFGIGVEMGNLFSDGHLLSLRSVLGAPPRNMTSARVGYIAPVGFTGQKLHFSYTRGDFDVGRILEKLAIRMESESIRVAVSYPFIKERFSGLSGEVGLERNNFTQETLGIVSSQDRIRLLRGELNYHRAAHLTRDFVSLQLSQGLGTLMGGMGRVSSLASRPGADNQFTKMTIDGVRIRTIPEPYWMYHPFSVMLSAALQVSSDDLVVGEQFPLGGPDSVRGYPSGEFLGDHGYRMNSELRISPLPNTEKIQAAFFLDHAGGFMRNRLRPVIHEQYLTGIGFGIRFNFPRSISLREPGEETYGYILDYQFQIRADVGYPLDPHLSSSGKNPVYAIQAVGRF